MHTFIILCYTATTQVQLLQNPTFILYKYNTQL